MQRRRITEMDDQGYVKIRRYWKFVDEFPMTVTGKIQKFRMREVAIQELGLSV